MKKLICCVVTMASCVAAHAAVTASISEGTSYLHLGTLSKPACVAVMESPVTAGVKVAVDGNIGPADSALCHDRVKVDLVETDPVVKVTKDGITTWPLAKGECVETSSDLLPKGRVLVNGKPVERSTDMTAACSGKSNSVTVPR
ncbi:hypothetical protein [Paraburkholderia youngii]|uniref:hypothetical protein n=1 Tax=Paraburkholderia youngii TaxID=2782701 RepID=UPI003D1F889A